MMFIMNQLSYIKSIILMTPVLSGYLLFAQEKQQENDPYELIFEQLRDTGIYMATRSLLSLHDLPSVDTLVTAKYYRMDEIIELLQKTLEDKF